MPQTFFDLQCYLTAGLTDKGTVRGNNEDALLVMPEYGCFAVSDGMGGADAGEISSSIVTGYLSNALKNAEATPEARRQAVSDALYASNKAIARYAERKKFASMGATVTCLLLDPWVPGRADIYHAGDSRLYRLRKKSITLLTSDHTVANASGIPDANLPRYMQGTLTNVVGIVDKFFLDCATIEVMAGDIFLLCSDGLYRQINEKKLRQELTSDRPLEQTLAALRDQANNSGGIDNLTAVVVKVLALPAPYSPAPAETETEQRRIAAAKATDAATSPTED